MQTGDYAASPAYAIVAAIVKLVPDTQWSYAGLRADATFGEAFGSPDVDVSLPELQAELARQRQKARIGPRIAASLGPLGDFESGITMLFADSRTTFGILRLLRTTTFGLFTSTEVAMLTFALDSASDRLSALRSALDGRVRRDAPAPSAPPPLVASAPEGAMYVLDRDLGIALSWSPAMQRHFAASGLRTRNASRLPIVLEECVRSLTAGWPADDDFAPGLAHPLPFLALRTTPLSGNAGVFVGVRIDRVRPSNSLTVAATRYHISPREEQVLALLLDGQHLEEIARGLSITASTVQDHIKSMTAKTASRNRSELIAHVLGWEFALKAR